MSTAYAPFQNAMRLGQGFNSYTQNVCIDSAVTFESSKDRDQLQSPADSSAQRQIVTYSSQYVDKLSDVVEATNLSPSTAIKSGSIGNSGKGGGGFIDCDKFKQADLNLLIHVKVISHSATGASEGQQTLRFNRIKNLSAEQFNSVFGDCFISGFLEGGEFTALVCVKINEGEKNEDVRVLAKVGLTALNGEEEHDRAVRAGRKVLLEKTVMTVNVNWSGGGQLKEETEQWDIERIWQVASAFPEKVQKTPQRIAAVLSKYTTLRSFLEQMSGVVPLDYDNVLLYTGDLLDAYMEYKNIVKQLNFMLADPEQYEEADEPEDESREDLKPIRLVLSELDRAKTFCRSQMLKIVKEVDNIAINPSLATSDNHVPPYMSSELFASRIPTRKPLESQVTPVPQMHEAPITSYTSPERNHIIQYSHFAPYFLFSLRSGSKTSPPHEFASQLLSLPIVAFPVKIELFVRERLPRGIIFHYDHIPFTVPAGHTMPPVKSVSLELCGEKVVNVVTVSALCWKEEIRLVTWMRLTTDKGRKIECGDRSYCTKGVVRRESAAPADGGLKGVYGGWGDAIDAIGFIWGRQ